MFLHDAGAQSHGCQRYLNAEGMVGNADWNIKCLDHMRNRAKIHRFRRRWIRTGTFQQCQLAAAGLTKCLNGISDFIFIVDFNKSVVIEICKAKGIQVKPLWWTTFDGAYQHYKDGIVKKVFIDGGKGGSYPSDDCE